MKILLKLSYLTIFIILVLARKAKKIDYDWSRSKSSSEEVKQAHVARQHEKTDIDIAGDLRKYFALEAALLDTNSNMICSPLSAMLPLAKLALGATDTAETELLSAIGLNKTSDIPSTFKNLIKALEYLPGVTLDIASRFYVNEDVKIKSTFKNRVVEIFNSAIDNIAMSSPKHAADEINEWVSKNTRGMIPTIIEPDDLPPETVMILVNAIFFVGFWKNPFNKVVMDYFHTTHGQHRIPMMLQQDGSFNYCHDEVLNAQIVELPYLGGECSFILVLPFNTNGLPLLLKQLKLAPNLLPKALTKLRQARVNLTMPKFKIETQLDLMSLYKKVGVTNIFETKSSLTRIVKGDPVYVTKALQRAVIEVNELGTKAAAVSGTQTHFVSYTQKVQFLADRPFVFFIQTKRQQLFAGIFNGN